MDDSRIIKTEYSEEMQKSFIDYAMSVIIARALPDVRDGLKPVQRRTLYDMHELGIRYDRPYRKSARIVGDTMGKYHPHGDSSIYEALVVMSQDFKKGMPLIDGHGNFGNIEGDGAAAMRYTEARLQKVTQEAFLADLDKDVVDFVPNFDEEEKMFPFMDELTLGKVSFSTLKYSSQAIQTEEDEQPYFMVKLEQELSLDSNEIFEWVERFEKLAMEFSGDYIGWECDNLIDDRSALN